MGELHPVAFERYDFTSPIIAAELDLERILDLMQTRFDVTPVSDFPPVLEDIAVIVEESLPAEQVEALIRQTGGKLLASVKLFDVFRSEQVGEGKKSLAYAMVYQKMDGTLTDKEATQIRTKIIQRLERELGAKLRS
jgi:phenylalanyl-tRNA synthetase beta chain